MSIINLLPEDYIQGRLRWRANVLCLVLFATVITAVVGTAMFSRHSARHTEEVDQRVQKDYEDAAKLIQQMHQLENEKQRLHQKALSAIPLMERVPRSSLLAVVTNSLPKHASLIRFDMETQKKESESQSGSAGAKKATKFAKVSSDRLTSSSQAAVTVKITGLASTDVEVARFIANMARNPLMKSVDLVYSQEKLLDKNDPLVREFQVKAELQQDVDAINIVGNQNALASRGAVPLKEAQGMEDR